MHKRSNVVLSAVVLAALLLLIVATAARADEPVRLKIATLAPRGSMYHRSLQEVAAAITAGAGPGASSVIYTDGTQGGEADVVRRMRIGQLNGGLLSAVGLAEIDPAVGVLQKMPLLFRTAAEVEYVTEALRPQLEQRLADRGFVVLFWGTAGWVRFFSKQPLAVPDDLKARRLFAWAGDPQQVELMKELGYHPVVLETADVVPGLETGLIDAVPLAPVWALSMQADTLAPNMIDLRWAPITGALVVSRRIWDALPPATQVAVRTVAVRVATDLRAYQERADRDAVVAMVQRGLKVARLGAAQEGAWQALAERIYPLLRGRTVPADTFDAAVRALAAYRAAPAATGGAR